MKKVLTIAAFALMTVTLMSATLTAIIFSDTTTIENDLINLNLNLDDYVKLNDSQYDYSYVVALSEAYVEGNVNLYVYVYNPYNVYAIDLISISLNQEDIENYIPEFVSVDMSINLSKYRINSIATYDSIERIYKINKLIIGTSELYDGFTATISQSGSSISYNYDSYIVITEKELIDYCFFPNTTGLTLPGFPAYTSFQEYWSGWIETFGGDCKPEFFFLNFDTNKPIDKILEIDVTYSIYQGLTVPYFNYGIAGSVYYPSLCKEEIETIIEGSKKTYTAESPRTIYNADYVYEWNLFNGKISTISTPASSRIDHDELKYSLNTSALDSFNTRDHSVLIDVQSFYDTQSNIKWNILPYTEERISKWQIEDASITRILYETNGVTFNARTNSGSLIDSVNGNEVVDPAEGNWWDNVLKYIADFFGITLENLYIIFYVFIGIIALGILGPILPVLFQLIGYTIKGILQIIKLPFSILGLIFKKRGK